MGWTPVPKTAVHKHDDPLATEEERLDELATMLRGEARGATTRQEAAEMLKTARKQW